MGGKSVIDTAIISAVQPSSYEAVGNVILEKLRELRTDGGDWRVGAMTTTLLHPDTRKGERVMLIVVLEKWG